MEHEGSLPCSQKPATSPYPDPNESSPHASQNLATGHFLSQFNPVHSKLIQDPF
jgi:hypothetical protein